ncbi:MAG TPA: class I SAM-dependent methyltransferase [Terriglobales bacterium]|jgi:SAM-dependent methyltransferase|nr:class I SAM-dependent methyltransferase [Terriglobales bacterium]
MASEPFVHSEVGISLPGDDIAAPAAAELPKASVRRFWNRASCGEVYALGADFADQMRRAERSRYTLEPYIEGFADFSSGKERDVLEIGVGMGCDHLQWARSHPRRLCGIDLTPRAISIAQSHLALHGLHSELEVGDAEALPYEDESFDLVYSFGVLHHSPDTPRAIAEVRRVLRPGGTARIMIYHRMSLTGLMLWLRYALLALRPLRSLDDIYAQHLESPGTKAYSVREARELFRGFSDVRIGVQLNHGDLLEGEAGQRHQGALLTLARKLWPRGIIRRMLPRLGLYLMIDATR